MISAREAMQRAESFAELEENFEAARFWLDFARELREEAANRRAWGVFDPAPVKAQQTDTTVLRRPDERPGEAIAGDGHRCSFCGYFLGWDSERGLVHTRTGQATCPVGKPGPDDTIVHTFATVDDQGDQRYSAS